MDDVISCWVTDRVQGVAAAAGMGVSLANGSTAEAGSAASRVATSGNL